ncbi:hypothetical protein CR513_29655, partial [Mucuna pruriens]
MQDHGGMEGKRAGHGRKITIIGIGGVTRSGRIYAPEKLWKKDQAKEKKKEKMGNNRKEAMMEEKEIEFLKLICHSEYKLLDQLNKTLA